MAMSATAMWPLFGLEVRTPAVTLRYLTDELCFEVAALAAHGVHDPAVMPFAQPWTDVAAPELQHNALRYYWRQRAETSIGSWSLLFAVIVENAVVGMCVIDAAGFLTSRTAETGSWLGLRHQGRGLGTEMRRAALSLIFDGLDARTATTAAWHDNIASLRVTEKLGYTRTEIGRQPRRGRQDTMVHFAMSRAQWGRLSHPATIFSGLEEARAFLGIQAR